MIFEISEKANEDLENIWLYTYDNWSEEHADRYYNLILNEIEDVAKHFESGQSMEHIRKGYRSTKVKSHPVFFRKSKRNTVEIIRILHQRMEIENHL